MEGKHHKNESELATMTRKHTIILAVVVTLFVSALVHAQPGHWHPVITSNPPTLSGCPACTLEAESIDTRGRVTCSDGPNNCTVTFAWPTRPRSAVCVFSSTSTAVVRQTSAPTTTAFTFSTSTAGPHSVDYICDHGAPRIMP